MSVKEKVNMIAKMCPPIGIKENQSPSNLEHLENKLKMLQLQEKCSMLEKECSILE